MIYRFKPYRSASRWASCLLLALLPVLGCVAGRRPPSIPAPPLSDDLDAQSLRAAVRRSIAYLQKLPPEKIIGERPRLVRAHEALEALKLFGRLVEQDCRECWWNEARARFDFIPASDDSEAFLFTGYYQPVIDASLVPTPEYTYPIYGKPADLIVAEQVKLGATMESRKVAGRLNGEDFVPYFSRREIDQEGALRGRGYEIAWVKNPVDLFFLHIQGSGILRLPDGSRLQIGYAAANGRPYRSVGRRLIDSGKMTREEMSMQALRRYFEEHPQEQSEIMAYNESYVFFRFLEEGPLGSISVPLTPGRSIATDPRAFPEGALAFAVTEKPLLDGSGQLAGWEPFSRFVLSQDTGGAIRGARADLYFGAGAQAGAAAGYMNRPGKLYLVLPKRPPAAGE